MVFPDSGSEGPCQPNAVWLTGAGRWILSSLTIYYY
jgi:hypothetical protein